MQSATFLRGVLLKIPLAKTIVKAIESYWYKPSTYDAWFAESWKLYIEKALKLKIIQRQPDVTYPPYQYNWEISYKGKPENISTETWTLLVEDKIRHLNNEWRYGCLDDGKVFRFPTFKRQEFDEYGNVIYCNRELSEPEENAHCYKNPIIPHLSDIKLNNTSTKIDTTEIDIANHAYFITTILEPRFWEALKERIADEDDTLDDEYLQMPPAISNNQASRIAWLLPHTIDYLKSF